MKSRAHRVGLTAGVGEDAVGFGVRTAEHVRTLAHVPGLDGVIIGTEFLRQVEKGAANAKSYLADIFAALPLPSSSTSTSSSKAGG